MSTATTPTTAAPTPTRTHPPADTGGGFRGALGMEWTKLWSVRSTRWCLAAAAVLMVGFTLLLGFDIRTFSARDGVPAGEDLFAVGQAALIATNVVQFALVALAMLTITSEYSTGSIRGTLQSVPRRGRLLAAKALVVVGTLTVVGAVLGAVGAVTATFALGPYAEVVVADAVVDVGTIALYTGCVAALTLGIGTALRSAAGTLTVVILLVAVLPGLLTAFGIDLVARIGSYLPGAATNQLLSGAPAGYSAATAVAVLLAWALAMLGVGGMLLRRRDA